MRQLLLTTCDGPVSTGATRAVGTVGGHVGHGLGRVTYVAVAGVHVERAMPTMWRGLPTELPAADLIARFRDAKAPKAGRPPRGSP